MINDIGRKHWWTKVKEIREWETIIKYQTLGKLPKEPLLKASLALVRHSSRCPDYDNLVQSFKGVVDSLIKNKIIKNDSMDVIGKPDYRWEKAKNKQGFIEVEVYEGETPKSGIVEGPGR